MFTESTRFVVYAVLPAGRPVGQSADVDHRAAVTRTEALGHAANLRCQHAAHGVTVLVVDAMTLDDQRPLAAWECHGRSWTQTRSWPVTEGTGVRA